MICRHGQHLRQCEDINAVWNHNLTVLFEVLPDSLTSSCLLLNFCMIVCIISMSAPQWQMPTLIRYTSPYLSHLIEAEICFN